MPAASGIKGRRLPDGDERLLKRPSEAQPGDYGIYRGYTGDKPALFFELPTGDRGHITFPPHEYEVHEDDSITVSPSILQPGEGGWHGYLRRGVWESL